MKGWLWLAAILSIVCAGCRKNTFRLSFSLPEDIEANYNTAYYADSEKGGRLVQGVAVIMGGKCELNGVTALPTLIYLTGGSFKVPVTVYAERGNNITVTGDTVSPFAWRFGGNKINERLSDWRNANIDVLSKGNNRDINNVVAAYVEENPGDPVSTLLLLVHFDRNIDEEGFFRLWNTLEGEAREDKWKNLVARSDMTFGPPRPPGRLVSMVMRKYPAGLDTLYTAGKEASLLVFRSNHSDNLAKIKSELIKLSEDYPDSSSRLIADICIEPDSLQWRMNLRRDTIEGVARLWTPMGLNEPGIMKLGVGAVPYFIVFTPEGYQEYRGTDMDSALVRFRKLMEN